MHSLSNINEELRTGDCSICGSVRITLRDKTKKKLNSKYRCRTVHRASNNRNSYPYRKHKKNYCEKCGFIPEHMVQLDVDHIDGNNKNNDLSNLQTLCANCHRYKTFLNKDGSYKFGLLTIPCPVDNPEN
jgi:5-methylcytosine-specific restriction endonuclease McrA